MDEKYFIFREVTSAKELVNLLRFRYRVYRESRLQKFCPENDYGIGLDCFDLRARHFGLFFHDLYTMHPVGYMRVVEDENSCIQEELLRLVSEYPSLSEKLKITPKDPFPLMTYYPEAVRRLKLKKKDWWNPAGCRSNRLFLYLGLVCILSSQQ